MQGFAPTVATSPWIRAAFFPLHKDHSVALPAWGSHSYIQRERGREGDRKIENRMLRNERRESRHEQERDIERVFKLYVRSVCPYCVQLVLEQRTTRHRPL